MIFHSNSLQSCNCSLKIKKTSIYAIDQITNTQLQHIIDIRKSTVKDAVAISSQPIDFTKTQVRLLQQISTGNVFLTYNMLIFQATFYRACPEALALTCMQIIWTTFCYSLLNNDHISKIELILYELVLFTEIIYNRTLLVLNI